MIATYENNNTTEDITNQVEWIASQTNAVEINNNLLKPKQDKVITLQAKYKNSTSNQIQIIVYKVINGHRLPPKPDEELNNSTLIGIDINDNGVRDDVEWLIYEKYSKKLHQTISRKE